MTASFAKSTDLNPLHFPLSGSRLIEASAGTGKTWTIAALVVRLVLGHGKDSGVGFGAPLSPADILVMTFTRAATRELRERIRSRLAQASRIFRGADSTTADDFLQQLLADYPSAAARTEAAWRLAQAADQMDEAAVYTIDAWCQRVLREHAFDSGSLFDLTLVPDQHALQADAIRDYWRQHILPLAPDALTLVLAEAKSIKDLDKNLNELLKLSLEQPALHRLSLAELLTQHAHTVAQTLHPLRQHWAQRVKDMQQDVARWRSTEKADWNLKLMSHHVPKWLDDLADWATRQDTETHGFSETAIERLTPDGLRQARKNPNAPWTPPAWADEWAVLHQALQQLPAFGPQFRQHAVTHVQARLDWLKQRAGQLGFEDLQQRLYDALHGPNGAVLRQRIVQQYPIALIDEFQDTSPLQYAIFNRIYDSKHAAAPKADADVHVDPPCAHALLMIGDPKQSIYGFRGADIHSYLRARRATAGRHHVLGINYRSSAALVDIVNHCFAQADAQLRTGVFGYASSGSGDGHRDRHDNPLPFLAVRAQGHRHTLVHRPRADAPPEPWPALHVLHELPSEAQPLSKTAVQKRVFAQRAAERIVHWLNDPTLGFMAHDRSGEGIDPTTFQPLQAKDIAVLVRTQQEAKMVQHTLRVRGVASVFVSDKASVLDTDEARDLVHWLRAVAAPRDVRLVRAALATRTFGLLDHELRQLTQDDEALDRHCEHFRLWQDVWHHQGVLAMVRRSLHDRALPRRWLAELGGERILANVLHLGELLQTAAHELEGDIATLRWLEEAREHALAHSEHTANDTHLLRLESDANLVKIVTIHQSKGLEYPVVVLPFAWACRRIDKKNATALRLPPHLHESSNPDDPLHTVHPLKLLKPTVKLSFGPADIVRADAQRLKEDMRLLYVAMTRARCAVWLGFTEHLNDNKPHAQHSALGRLWSNEDAETQDWQAQIAHFFEDITDPSCLRIDTVTEAVALTPLRKTAHNAALPPVARVYHGQFERAWGISSFSGLGKHQSTPSSDTDGLSNTAHTASADHLGASALSSDRSGVYEPAEDEAAAPQASARFAPTADVSPAADAAAVWHRFPRGPQAGNFLHSQLEWLSQSRFDLSTPQRQTRLMQHTERAGYGDWQADIVSWLQAIGQHTLPGVDAALQDMDRVLPEMEFWLPADHANTAELDRICRIHWLVGQPRPVLSSTQVHGILMGVADLVVEHQGMYWVLDYKSNHLGSDDAAYTHEAIAASLAEHRYDAQAAIYLLALHRLLRSRLQDDYDPSTQLGGAIYYYLRGFQGPAQGVCILPASPELLKALDAWLGI